MTFEEWWDGVATQDTWVETLCREAWEEGGRGGFREGRLDSQEIILDLQQFIHLGMSADARMVADAHAFMKEFDICPECRSVYGQHKMDCGRQQ